MTINSTNDAGTDGMTIDMIERGIDMHPTCVCGRPTTAVVHGTTMWVECTLLSAPIESRLRRIAISATSYLHTREAIGELAAA